MQEQRAKLVAERDALLGMLAGAEQEMWPALIDAVEVDFEFETALGAALGDDLDASADGGAPVHWRGLPPLAQPPLPSGVEPLSARVRGPEVLLRRLRQIGIVEGDRAIGDALQASLAQGQRLVTAEGDLWRWDGFVARLGAPTAAATRLARRRRLAELAGALGQLESELGAVEEAFVGARTRAVDADARERQQRQAEREAADALMTQERPAEAQATSAVSAANSRLMAVMQALDALGADLAEVEASLAASRHDRAQMPDLSEKRQKAQRQRAATCGSPRPIRLTARLT